MRGHVWAFKLDVKKTMTSVPLRTATVPFKVLVGTRYTDAQFARVRDEYKVDPKVLRALYEWAKQHNRFFSNVEYDKEAEREATALLDDRKSTALVRIDAGAVGARANVVIPRDGSDDDDSCE